MTTYDFDTVIDRRGTHALKLDALKADFGHADLLPLWIADMDFATPPFVLDALRRRLDHPILGYTAVPDEYYPTIARWLKELHGWHVQPEWLTYIPGIVKGIGMVINVFLRPGDKVIIQPPVYPPFRHAPEDNGHEVVENPLLRQADGTYRMDFEQLARVADERCKLLILSNPHNPGGILWDDDTLRQLARFCLSRGILVVSDEIHADMALWGRRHRPFASVCEEAAACSVTFGAPSKTFNIAGVVSSYAVVPDTKLRERFFGWLTANELNEPTVFAPIATMAAFTQGAEWRRQMLRYVEENVRFVEEYCAEHLPAIRPLRPEASFLVWLDCRALGLGHDKLIELFTDRARLALNDGETFGTGGEGYMRLNVGTPRSILREALERLRRALADGGTTR